MSRQYEILSIDELNKIELTKVNEIKTSYIVDYNGAFVTIYRDGSAIVRPPVLGEKQGLLFHNVEDMNAMIASRSYPVKGNNTFWEKEKARVLDFTASMPHYCFMLSQMLNFKVELNNDHEYLLQLSQAVTNVLQSKKSNKDTLYGYVAIYIGELLRQKVGGEWKLLPQRALNVYYVPEIAKGNTYCHHWSFVLNELKMARFIPVDIERLVERSSEFYPASPGRHVAVA